MNNNKKATKRALLTSVMALVMCVVMLVGTTFAWFTDTASTAVNKIVAGNLDVELLMYKNSTDGYVNISKDKNPIFGSDTSTVAQNNNLDTLWEPGKTQVAYLAIKNEGNLALKYKVALNVTNPVDGKDLYKVMQYAIVPDAQPSSAPTAWTTGSNVTVGQQAVSGEVSLGVGATHYFALLVHMDELAGNSYQNGKVDFDLTVYATQDTVENDSFDNKYDENAQYPDVDVVTVTPDTIPSPFKANTAYFFEAGNYGDQHFVITDKENVTLIGKTGAKFDSLQISSIDYVNPSIGQEVDLDNSTLTVKGFEVAKTLMIVEADKNVVVEDNTAAQITVKANLSSQSIAVNNNIITGGDGAANGYGVYIVPNVTDYDLTVTGNSFTNVKSHAISVQGCGDGSAVTAAKSITVTGNTFTSYGTNNKTGRAAFKIWEDTKLAPNSTDPLNDAANALAKTVKENNSFAAGLGENCVVADFYGKTVALTTNP